MSFNNFTLEEVLQAKFVSAGPSPSGEKFQARFRVDGKLRTLTVVQAESIRPDVLLPKLNPLLKVHKSQLTWHGKTIKVLADGTSVRKALRLLGEECGKAIAVAKSTSKSEVLLRQDRHRALVAMRRMRRACVDALHHGASKEELCRIVEESEVESIQNA